MRKSETTESGVHQCVNCVLCLVYELKRPFQVPNTLKYVLEEESTGILGILLVKWLKELTSWLSIFFSACCNTSVWIYLLHRYTADISM